METLKKPRSIKIIYWITNITFWIYVASGSLLMILAMVFIMGGIDNSQLHVGVPIGINLLEQGTFEMDNLSVDVLFSEMTGKIHFIDTPTSVSRIYGVFMMVIALLFFYIFWIFRQFIKQVNKGLYFDRDNISSLKKIAYALVSLWFFSAFYGYFQYFYLAINLNFNSIEITSQVNTYPTILLAALFIWVLSHIFEKGCSLQTEQNLTV